MARSLNRQMDVRASPMMDAVPLFNDPWTWTAANVAMTFCRPTHDAWAGSPAPAPLDLSRLGSAFIDNGVDGATLLEQVDVTVLKDEFQITKFGDRAAIMRAIQRLRSSSPGYETFRATIEAREIRVRAKANEASPVMTPVHQTPQPPITPTTELSHQIPTSPLHGPTPNLRPGETLHNDGRRKRRRIELTRPPTNANVVGNRYLSREAVSIDDIFYPTLKTDDEETDPDDDFSINIDHHFPAGHCSFIRSRMRHQMLSRPEYKRDRAIQYPYPERLVKEGKQWSATLFTVSDGVAHAKRRDALFVESTEADFDDNAEHDTSWDYLLNKYSKQPNGDEELPLYNESGSENDYEGSLLDEIEQEQADAGESTATRYLSDEEVEDIVDKALRIFETRWQEEKLPHRERRAYSAWRNSQGRNGPAYLHGVEDRLVKLKARLARLRKAIVEEKWTNAHALEKQCSMLELTSYDVSEGEWQLRVAQSPRPQRLPALPRAPVKQKVPNYGEESGESVDSSDAESFIEDDATPNSRIGSPSSRLRPSSSQDGSPSSRVVSPSPRNVSPSPRILSRVSVVIPARRRRSSESEDSVLGHVNVEDDPTPLEHFRKGTIVDLTSSPPSARKMSGRYASTVDYTVEPEKANERQISQWDWNTLLESADRKWIVRKLLNQMEPGLRKRVEKLVYDFGHERLVEDNKKALKAIKNNRNSIAGVDSNSPRTEALFMLARLWTCWNSGTRAPISDEIDEDTIGAALKMDDFRPFFDFLRAITDVANESDSEDSDPVVTPLTPRKKRVGKVMKDRNAQQMREQAHERRRAGEERELNLKIETQKTQNSGPLDDPEAVIVNTTKEDDDDFIYLNPYIGRRVKEHQIKGIRFMWRELVGSARDLQQGCLLSHTMGLGKTMQTISLLVTIAEAALSDDDNIANQIPKSMRKPQILILCPAVLVGNWADEFKKWLPPHINTIGKVFPITDQVPLEDRLEIINNYWYKSGGVLLLSYHMFRNFLPSKDDSPADQERPPQKERLNRKEREDLRKSLLEQPAIVVADEAHTFKNKKSGISRLVKKFKTKSRIALTGSPLANNLQDYYAMIDWVAPGFLGDEEEFRAYYQEPIEAGTYADSTKYEQKRSIKKLRALKADIDPKVDRAGVEVLKGDLTPKTEFVLTLPLTVGQKRLYETFVNSLRGRSLEESTNTSIWDWMHLLRSLCNHPWLTQMTLNGRIAEVKKTKKQKSSKTADQPEDEVTMSQKVARGMLERLQNQGLSSTRVASLSVKIPVILEIVKESKRVGDQVLIFSTQMQMLDYLELTIPEQLEGVRLTRLDGRTKMSTRLDSVKQFNDGSSDVFLLSTRAAGFGLNIPGANRVILCDFGFNPTYEEQAVGRAYRIGQTKEVFVYHLVTGGTFEEKLHNVTIFKRQLAFRVVDDKRPERQASKAKEYLFPPQDIGQQDLAEFYGKDKVMDRLLQSNAGQFIRNLQTTETMHAEIEETLNEADEKEVEAMIADDKLRKSDHAAWELKNRPAYLSSSYGMPANYPAASTGAIPGFPNGSLHAHPGQSSMPGSSTQPNWLPNSALGRTGVLPSPNAASSAAAKLPPSYSAPFPASASVNGVFGNAVSSPAGGTSARPVVPNPHLHPPASTRGHEQRSAADGSPKEPLTSTGPAGTSVQAQTPPAQVGASASQPSAAPQQHGISTWPTRAYGWMSGAKPSHPGPRGSSAGNFPLTAADINGSTYTGLEAAGRQVNAGPPGGSETHRSVHSTARELKDQLAREKSSTHGIKTNAGRARAQAMRIASEQQRQEAMKEPPGAWKGESMEEAITLDSE